MKKCTLIIILASMLLNCSSLKQNAELNALRTELDSLKNAKTQTSNTAPGQITTFLTFQENNAEEAMNFYVGLFDNSRIVDIQRYGKGGPAKEGTIMVARFELDGSKFACSDSYITHDWTFTPGVSILIDCTTEDEIEKLFAKLAVNGNVLMPLNNYGFSSKFAFVEDQFGISWQLNLE